MADPCCGRCTRRNRNLIAIPQTLARDVGTHDLHDRLAVRAASITTNRNLKIAVQASLIGEQMPRIELLVSEPPAYYTLNATELRRELVY